MVGLTTLYKLALHRSLPWHRLFGGALIAMVFFMTASDILRRYLTWAARTGISYGALATPIAFLLFTFFLAFAVILGAEFNATVQEFWPARATRYEQFKLWWARHHGAESSADGLGSGSETPDPPRARANHADPQDRGNQSSAADGSSGGAPAGFDSAGADAIGDRRRRRIRPTG